MPGLGLDFGIPFWTLLPAFLFLGVIISIQANGAAIALQRASYREDLAVDFRQVQGAMAGAGATNFLAGIAGAVPNIIHPGIVSYLQITGVAARGVGYTIGCVFLAVAFLPKVSGLLSSIPGPVMTGYLILITGTLFVDGAQTVIQSEQNKQKVVVAGMCFWIGAAFQFNLFNMPDLGLRTRGPVQERNNDRRNRRDSDDPLSRVHQPPPHAFSVPAGHRCAAGAQQVRRQVRRQPGLEHTHEGPAQRRRRGDPPDPRPARSQSGRRRGGEGGTGNWSSSRPAPARSPTWSSSAAEARANIEDQVRQLQQHDTETPIEQEMSLRLLRGYASSVNHQQYHDTDIITVRVDPPAPAGRRASGTGPQ